ncbi:MAG: alpha-hydroxy-acid oxidizing protein, partial [Candidatus Hodarchaeales archaeon]
ESCYGLNAIKAADGWGVKIVKPRAQNEIINFFKQAEKFGATAVGIDTDGCGSYMMKKHNKPVFRKSSDELCELVDSTTLPVIIKGVMTPEDALKAVNAGAAAIVVSNHGGRVLDHTPGTAEVLPTIVKTLEGYDIPIYIDGGIRTGYDVLKVLALGANAALIGRDIVRAAVGGGSEGVRLQMDYLKTTLAKAMLMTGVTNLDEITNEIITVK